jgi:ankyrin repeat protein
MYSFSTNSRQTTFSIFFPTTLLFYCIEREAAGCLHYLLNNGASTKGRNVPPILSKSFRFFSSSLFPHNLTPLLAAIAKGSRMAVYALVNAQADTRIQDENGWTALHWAAHSQKPEIVEILLQFGADPNAVDFEGATPLHIAADGENAEIVTKLIDKGARGNIRNHFGVRADDKCVEHGFSQELFAGTPRGSMASP